MKNELLGLIKKAMLSKNAVELRTLRLIKSEFTEHETAKNAKELTPEVEISIITKMVKKRNDSIAEYTNANRMDLVKQEQEERDFLMTFLPTQMSDSLIEQKIKELKFVTIGECMKYFKDNYSGRYDGKTVNKIYNENK